MLLYCKHSLWLYVHLKFTAQTHHTHTEFCLFFAWHFQACRRHVINVIQIWMIQVLINISIDTNTPLSFCLPFSLSFYHCMHALNKGWVVAIHSPFPPLERPEHSAKKRNKCEATLKANAKFSAQFSYATMLCVGVCVHVVHCTGLHVPTVFNIFCRCCFFRTVSIWFTGCKLQQKFANICFCFTFLFSSLTLIVFTISHIQTSKQLSKPKMCFFLCTHTIFISYFEYPIYISKWLSFFFSAQRTVFFGIFFSSPWR